nr:MAG TPA: hypothetical protein [Caudoviricetes sp.]
MLKLNLIQFNSDYAINKILYYSIIFANLSS